jgi:hypothetical protein
VARQDTAAIHQKASRRVQMNNWPTGGHYMVLHAIKQR